MKPSTIFLFGIAVGAALFSLLHKLLRLLTET